MTNRPHVFRLTLSDDELLAVSGWAGRNPGGPIVDAVRSLAMAQLPAPTAGPAPTSQPAAMGDPADVIVALREQLAKTDAWARDEQAKRHRAEEHRTEARSALGGLSQDFSAMEVRAERAERTERDLRAGLIAARTFIRSEREVVFDSITVGRDPATIDDIDRDSLAEIDATLRLVEEALLAPPFGRKPSTTSDMIETYAAERRRHGAPVDADDGGSR